MEYRIVEQYNIFRIQVNRKKKITTGCLWWKESFEIDDWAAVDEFGFPLILSGPISITFMRPPLSPFKTLEEAQAKLKTFTTPAIYHYA